MKIWMLVVFALLWATVTSARPVKSSFFTNDFLGDSHDRWRSGSYTLFLGYEGENFWGMAHDYSFRAEIISPWGARAQANSDDRPYVGMLGFGLFANEGYGSIDINAGGEILFVGDQTGIADLQQGFHETAGIAGYLPENSRSRRVENDVTGMLSAEIARNFIVAKSINVRPYIGAQVGYETFARVGADLVMGGYAEAERFVRDPVSGFVQPSSRSRAERMRNVSFLIGADYTYVDHSDFFPDWSNVEMQNERVRVRAGIQAGVPPQFSVFFGLTHLSKEFTTQVESQTIGVLSLEFPF